MSCNNNDIIKGSDKIIDIDITLSQGIFRFEDYTRVRLIIKDKAGTEIQRCAYPTEGGYTTLRPVTRTLDATTQRYTYTTDTSSNIGQVFLLGSNTTGKKSGAMKLEYYFRTLNAYFDDNYNDELDKVIAFNLVD